MAEAGKAEGLIARAQGFGLGLEYRSGFLIVARPTSTDRQREDLVEMELAIIKQLGKSLTEVRAQVTAVVRAARGQDLLGQRVLIPIIGIGQRTLADGYGRVMRSQISGKLVDFSENGALTVSYFETRDDDVRRVLGAAAALANAIERTSRCSFDEAFIIVGGGEQPGGSSFGSDSLSSIGNEKMRGALERGQSIGLTLDLDAGIVVAKWNVAPEDQDAGEGILRELGPPRGELFSFLEGRARGAAGKEFVGQQCFVRPFDSMGMIKSVDLDGTLEVTYEHFGSSLTCSCNGCDALIIASEEAARDSSAEPAAPKNWLRRAFGSRQ
jgi:hypothetical protein